MLSIGLVFVVQDNLQTSWSNPTSLWWSLYW